MQDSKKVFLELRFVNMEARISAIEAQFIEYAEQNPKSDSQWLEERLRALEAQYKALDNYHCNIMEPRLIEMENLIRDHKQVVNADYDYIKTAYLAHEARIKEIEKNEVRWHLNIEQLDRWIKQLQQKQSPEQYNPQLDPFSNKGV